jgi:polysaccharide biosynthesis transport protein
MSKFLRAMQQAARERALLGDGFPPNGSPATSQLLEPALADQGGPNGAVTAPRGASSPPDSPIGRYGETDSDPTGRLDDCLVSLVRPTSFQAEQYRALRFMIEQRHAASGLSIVAVSSPGTGEGKTTTTINLAGALAQSPGVRVLLVDADLRHSSMAECLGLRDRHLAGLAEAILNPSLTLDQVVIRYPNFNLHVLPAGRSRGRPYEFFGSLRFRDLLSSARQLYDYVILDTPPLIPVPDSRVIATLVDGVLIVVAAHKTSQKVLTETLTISDPSKILGLVFNGDEEPWPQPYNRSRSTPRGRSRSRR